MNKKSRLHARLGVFGCIPIALLQDKDVKPNSVKVYAAISSFQGDKDYAFPGREKIAGRAGVSERACSDAVTNLVETGWIARRRRYGQSSVYECLAYFEPAVIDGQDTACAENLPDDEVKNLPDDEVKNLPNIKDHLKDQLKRSVTADKSAKLDTPFRAEKKDVETAWLDQYRQATGKDYVMSVADRATAKKLKIYERYTPLELKGKMTLWFSAGRKELKYYPRTLRSFYSGLDRVGGGQLTGYEGLTDEEVIRRL